ncbi:LytR/AlgR family response regulator transcription factor [Paraglaciecola arctica]|uniref:LytR/AlgR family response regulator transcription factor n=1 Tax=Paraglaciecola arctica TaxID=1128911 RepID=UPI001C075636|nr:LytTR family DNA-binding domain-containing protein [Paraglaciecola arctica]MBU3004730.1 LytTR family DNA-binding domain-containing protein [Paraglaciecola arctica]
MKSIVIVEDEYMVAKRLKRFVEQAFSQQPIKIKTCHSLDDAADYLAEHPIDLLFLDLNLQGQDGFTLLKQQLSQSFHTIVVSANSDRAIEAFEIGVLDFVAKPFTQERIQKAADRLQQQQGQSKYLTYKRLGKIQLLAISEVLYLKADGHYCEVYQQNQQSFLHDKSLDKLLNLLPDDFIRIHRSYAVSVAAIQSIEAEEGSKYWLTLTSGVRLPLGRTKVRDVKARLI